MATGAPSAALSRSSRRFATSVVGQNRRGDRRLALLPPVLRRTPVALSANA